MQRILITLFVLILLNSCTTSSGNRYADATPVEIHRFDRAVYQYVEQGDSLSFSALQAQYADVVDILGKGIFNVIPAEHPDFMYGMMNYYAEPTLNRMYQDALRQYESIEDIEKSLATGFAWFGENLPSLPQPQVYMHVSGFKQNVLVGENILSLSIDKYLGEDYPLYQDFFYPFQRVRMARDFVVQDYLTGWLMSEYPFTGNESVLLERMVYEGKIKYLVSEALSDRSQAQILYLSDEAFDWCKKNERALWQTIVERKQLYTPDHTTTSQYFSEFPLMIISDEAPGYLGNWMGWQIVKRYMKETKVTPEELLATMDAQQILTLSKYKP